MRCRPALAVLDILRGEGVDRVFGNPGTTELPFLAALPVADVPEYVLSVHEAAVVAVLGDGSGWTRYGRTVPTSCANWSRGPGS